MGVAELKLLLRRARAPALHGELQNALAAMLKQEGPAAFFILDGRRSGLLLPTIPRLTQTGYTFHTWLRVETFHPPPAAGAPLPPGATAAAAAAASAAHHLANEPWSPRLFSLLDEEGRGVEALFERIRSERPPHDPIDVARLRLRTAASATPGVRRRGESEVLEFRFLFKPGRWYHLGVAHVSTRLFAKSQATLYVDGKPQQNGLLRFPHTERLTSALVGTSAPPSVGGAHASSDAWHHAAALARPHSLHAQLGAVYTHSEALQPDALHQIWSLGPNFMWVHDLPDAAADQSWMSSLLLAFNPKSRAGDEFPNNAVAATADGGGGGASTRGGERIHLPATLRVGGHACVTQSVRESAQCLGGVRLLFPLLTRLPHTQPPRGKGEPKDRTGEELLVGLLGLMSQMLWDSAADQHFMLRRHGFAILAFLLRNYVSPGLWTVEAISACVQLTSCFASTEHLHHEAVT